jgi:hypothetical protein
MFGKFYQLPLIIFMSDVWNILPATADNIPVRCLLNSGPSTSVLAYICRQDTDMCFAVLSLRYGVNYVMQIETDTSEPLAPEPSAFENEMAIEKLKGHKSPDIDQFQQKCLKQVVGQLDLRSIN